MLVYLAYTSMYIVRINLSIASPILINSSVLTTVQTGALGSIFSTAFAAGRPINGGLSDSKPPWLMLTVGLCGAGISNILISFFPPFIAIFLLWTLNAYAQSMLWSSVLCVVSAIYSEKTAKKKMTLMVTSVAMGNILEIVVNTILIKSLGERFAFLIPGAITLILATLILFATKRIENPHSKPAKHIPFF